ncbi:hypothetical protein LTR50_005085 [Elasticomyces elasticus]|nr:hypothetical protein LTR50_005085 [Elasticomyces elasticus]
MSQPEEPLNIVVLGASFAGLSVAHHFLDHTIKRLSTTPTSPTYRLILVSPSTHIYWNIGAPRVLAAPNLIPHTDAFIPIEPGFRRHKGADFTFIQGFATGIDVSASAVTLVLIGATASKRASQLATRRSRSNVEDTIQTILYHALILATGSQAHSPLLSLHGPHERTIAALESFHKRLTAAKSMVVCGGGPSGIETAGQLATYSSHGSEVKGSRPTKKITLITGTARCLTGLSETIGQKAEKQLKQLGVDVIHKVRVFGANEDPSGTVHCVLSDDTTLEADLYIAATGVVPNTAYMPTKLLDAAGYIRTNAGTLRVDQAGARVFAVGDCASYSGNYVLDVYDAVPVAMHNLLNDLLVHELRLASPYGGNEDEIDALEDAVYEKNQKISQLCPIGRFGGVGCVFGIRVPSLGVWAFKGRDYRVGKAKTVVVNGNNPY